MSADLTDLALPGPLPAASRPWRSVHLAAALGLMLASGFAGLGYQIVWTQQGALWLGHEAAAVLAVLTAFFGGVSAGALLLGPRVERSAHPLRWYIGCELTIAGWSLAVSLLMAPLSEALLQLIGPEPGALWQGTVAFAGSFLLLLPATAAMGATLPAMARMTAGIGGPSGPIAALYASNTLGAVLGVLATAFWLIPAFGLQRTASVCVGFNLLCALAALLLMAPAAAVPRPAAAPASGRTLGLLAATGLLGIGYEVLVVRVLSQVAEDTVFTYALLLAVYLVGTAAGAAAHACGWPGPGRAGTPRAAQPRARTDRLLCLQAAACLLGTASLWGAERLLRSVQAGLGGGMAGALAAEATLALAAFALPTFVMGALFGHLGSQARAGHHGFGRALGINTLAAAAAPPLFGVLLVPAIGPKAALLLVAGAYLLLARPRFVAKPVYAATAVAAVALALWAPRLAFVDVPAGGRLLAYHEAALAAASVVEDADGIARLRINNRQQEGSSGTVPADARQALLPLLLHPAPRHALFLGLGTGVTAAAAAQDPGLAVDVAELLPEVIAASAHFQGAIDEAFGGGAPARRPRVIAADARRFVRTAAPHYDLIVADNFHPARSGSGALYTVEHFRAVRERLADDGLFCQWLPLHQLDRETLRSIVRSFVAVYPSASALLATNSLQTPVLGLIARSDGTRFDLAAVRERLARTGLPRPLRDFGLANDLALFGGFVAGPRALAGFAREAPLNTDDRPVVAYRAPRITYAPDTLPSERLSALLHELRAEPDELIDAGADAAWLPRLAAYWRARDAYLDAGRGVRLSSSARQMLAQVREPLLAVLRISPDFQPARDPLLRLADQLARSDPAAADALRAELPRPRQDTP